ncbi:hypothetical protein [Nonomuraea cavernae]|uniref:Uncharacterized protein n=1 Tax=Nonomuraea cavernae TaxID=2045107 RepID=A0A918DSN2_9ACTN|nr:hypothetical protein [Nonomuraea cavernae]MCA2190267.1 hypothetical protein [Nonomuraea cavernae]GGO80459.1 hypothetical protein GCM10012289_67160 [Nonomuraea cavernae]
MRISLLVLAALVTISPLVGGLVGGIAGLERTGGGEVAVIRDGGPLDDNKVRQVIDPGSGLTWTGLWSSTHLYPAQQRFWAATSSPGCGSPWSR